MKALITGATRGIGRAVALTLASAGYDIATCARNSAELEALRNELAGFNVEVIAMIADATKKEDVYKFCEAIKNKWGNVDVLVNNAGMFLSGSIFDEPDDQFETQLQLNLIANYYFVKFFGKLMRKRQAGHIFNICSVASITPAENAGSYSVTKSALLCLNNVVRQELAQFHVKVTAILPGATLTSSWDTDEQPVNGFIKPQDIADVILSALSLSENANVDEIIIRPTQEN